MQITATEILFGTHRFQRTAVHGFILRSNHVFALVGDSLEEVDLGVRPTGWPLSKTIKPLLHKEYLFLPEHVLGYSQDAISGDTTVWTRVDVFVIKKEFLLTSATRGQENDALADDWKQAYRDHKATPYTPYPV